MIKRIAALMMLQAAAPALAQPAPAAVAASETRLRQLEAEWTNAVRNKDRAALDRLMTSDFELTFAAAPNEGVPRAVWLANLERMQLSRYEVEIRGVEVMGDVAVASVTGSWTVSLGGRSMEESFELRDTWVRRDGRWQVYRRHRVK